MSAVERSFQLLPRFKTAKARGRRYPTTFVWGVSTSSFQIEGAAREDGRGESIWDAFCRQQGRIKNNDTGEVACDHYHRYAEDVALMRDIGVGAYRFSVSWPRVLPLGRGAANEAGMAFYDRLIDALLAANIEPGSASIIGICRRRSTILAAGRAATSSAGSPTTRHWWGGDMVIASSDLPRSMNQAFFTLFGYGFGWGAPGISDKAAFHKAIHHVNLAHGAAVDVLRAVVTGASIGAIHNRQPCLPVSNGPDDEAAARRFEEYWNSAFPNPQHFASYHRAWRLPLSPISGRVIWL